MKQWCLQCGEAGKPEPATTVVEGDPLCAGCASGRGADVCKVPAPEEKPMATCACGCGGLPLAMKRQALRALIAWDGQRNL